MNERVSPFHPAADVARRFVHQPSIRVNGSRNAAVGGAQHPPVVLDGAHTGHIQVLARSSAFAVPTVIGDVHQHFGSALREETDLLGKDRFVTDEYSHLVAIEIEDCPLSARSEIPNVLSDLASKGKETLEGHIFAERHQMDLVVAQPK